MTKKQLPFQLAECHCLNLRRVSCRLIAQYDDWIQQADITVQQFSLLRHIRALSPLSVTDLAEAIGLDRTTLSRNLKVLEKKKLVQNIASSGRSKLFALTEEGQRVLSKAELLWQKAQAAFEEKLGPDRLRAWNETLALLLQEE